MDSALRANEGSFGRLLRRFLLEVGLTQEALAERARISPRAISDLERGLRRFPRRETVRLLAEALSLTGQDNAELEAAALRPARPAQRGPSRERHSAPSRLARLAGFVGRVAELTAFDESLAAAGARLGGVLMICGGPGIGKSRLMDEMAERARAQGWLVVQGRAYDMDAMPPYLPFAEALRSHEATFDVQSYEGLIRDAPEIAGLLPELRERIGDVLRPPSLGPEADRYRLFEAVTKVFATLARSKGNRGLVVCLDDLHWADVSTLALFEHVARRLTAEPLLFVATYRNINLDDAPALVSTLERLVRERLIRTLTLPPLDADEVALMLEALGGSTPPRELAEALHIETEGNALFVEEVFQFLLQRGLLFDPSGEWSHQMWLAEREIPQGIRLVIEGRLQRLSEDCRRVLSAGAVIGRTFSHELLRPLTALGDDALLDALEEAERAHVLVPAPATGALSFTHELIRQTMISELSLPRRQRLHERIVLAIEGLYASDLEPHLAELATHCRQANVSAALRKAVDYGVRAAEQAYGAFAYREAARLYEQALEAMELVQPSNTAARCDLLIALGRALLPEGESSRVLEAAEKALRDANRIQDDARARLACRLAMEALSRRGMRMVTLTSKWQVWAAEYEQYAGSETVDRVRLDIERAEHFHLTGREAEASQTRRIALELARRLGGRDEILYAASFCIYYTQAPRLQEERIRLAQEVAASNLDGVSARTRAFLHLYTGWAFWDWGWVSEARAAWAKLHALPSLSPDNFATFFAFFAEGCAAAIEGRLEDVVPLAYSAAPVGDRLGSPLVGRMSTALIAYRPLLHLGRAEEAARLMEAAWREAGAEEEPAYFKPRRLLALAHQGDHTQALALLEEIMMARRLALDGGDVSLADLLPLLEASVLLKHEEAAASLRRLVEPVAGLIESHVGTNTSAGRHLGDAAMLLGEPDRARLFYTQALEVCTHVGFRPEVALTRLSLGQLRLACYRDEHASAVEDLDFAVRELQSMKMQPALQRALRTGSP